MLNSATGATANGLEDYGAYGADVFGDELNQVPAVEEPVEAEVLDPQHPPMQRPNRIEMDLYGTAVRLLSIMDRRTNLQQEQFVRQWQAMTRQQVHTSWCSFFVQLFIVMVALKITLSWWFSAHLPGLIGPLHEMERAMNKSQMALGATQEALQRKLDAPQANVGVNCGGNANPYPYPYW